MSLEENKQIVSKLYELCTKGNLDAAFALMDPAYVFHMPGADLNVEQERQMEKALWIAFPDISFRIVNIIAEGDLVAFRVNIKGTHRGPFMGQPPTGKQIDLINSNWARIQNGKIMELWPTMDQLGLMQQLGMMLA